MKEEYYILYPKIKNWIHGEKILEDRVYLCASSIVRKDYTINRIRNLIAEHNLNLKVFEDNTMDFSDRFIIS